MGRDQRDWRTKATMKCWVEWRNCRRELTLNEGMDGCEAIPAVTAKGPMFNTLCNYKTYTNGDLVNKDG